jgi:hypothetical protein
MDSGGKWLEVEVVDQFEIFGLESAVILSAAVFQAERRACPEMKSKGSPTGLIYGRSLTRLKYAAFLDDGLVGE